MPKYKCTKEVWALRIECVQSDTMGNGYLYPWDEGYGEIKVSPAYMEKHAPYAGGYYVVYKDGYKSFSPPDAFQEGYELT